MAITAWSAKVLRSVICLSVNGRTSGAADQNNTDRTLFSLQRGDQYGSNTLPVYRNLNIRKLGRPKRHVLKVDQFIVHDRPTRNRTPSNRQCGRHKKRNRSFVGHEAKNVALHNPNRRVVGIAQSGGTIRMVSSTGWTSVGELAMTPRISLVAVCCSSDSPIPETSGRFDGDDGLVGEGFEQFDLRWCEGPYLDTTRDHDPMSSPADKEEGQV